MVKRESRPSTIGHITLDTKQTGAPSAGNPHAGCDVAGAGNGFTVLLLRHSQRKRGATARLGLRNTAPVLDPTMMITSFCRTHLALRAPLASVMSLAAVTVAFCDTLWPAVRLAVDTVARSLPADVVVNDH